MPADLLDVLRASDPAAALPRDEAARERLRRAVLSTPVPGDGVHPSRRRRLVVVACALALAGLVAAAGWAAVASMLTGPDPARSEFRDAQELVTLPAGARWVEPQLPADALYGRYAGLIAALGQATCAWFREWDAADRAGDRGREAAAARSVDRIRGLMPLHRPGDPEEAGGYDAASLAFFDRIVAAARAGRTSGLRGYVRANC
jgi:hypothetical protein